MSIAVVITYEDLTFGQKVGRGSYGEVYQGTCRLYVNQALAIKQLLYDKLPESIEKDLKREAELMANLRSPNIVQFYSIF